MLDATKTISFRRRSGKPLSIEARVVVEREWVDGELVEVSRNWFSRCRQTNDVFYFGEAVDIYENGQVVRHDGSWEAGVDGAQPGIIIPARFLLGSRYFQEQAPGEALDRAEHVDMGLTVEAAGETFDDCVAVVETSPLEPGHESVKVYCPDVGLVMDNEAVLSRTSSGTESYEASRGDHLEDLELVERMLAGDEEAFEAFGERYFRRLYRFALARLAGDRDLTREIVQTR